MNASGQNIAARFDMSLTADGKITEIVTQTQYGVASQLLYHLPQVHHDRHTLILW